MSLSQILIELKPSLQQYAEESIKEFDDSYKQISCSISRIVYELYGQKTYYVVYFVVNNEFKGTVLSEEKYKKIFLKE